MRTSRSIFFAALLALTLAGGCAMPTQVLNLTDQPVSTDKKGTTAEDVRGAIRRAGAGLGWQMKDDGPGKMSGTLMLRNHVAAVNVDYDATKYGIQYKDSSNLRYDAAKGTIHRNYNTWIQNLNKAIQRELIAMR